MFAMPSLWLRSDQITDQKTFTWDMDCGIVMGKETTYSDQIHTICATR